MGPKPLGLDPDHLSKALRNWYVAHFALWVGRCRREAKDAEGITLYNDEVE